MEVLGQGLGGIVVADAPNSVKKFYVAEDSGQAEQANLTLLGGMQERGFDIRCTIPRLLEVIGPGRWEVEGNVYAYCNRMERVPGISARRALPNMTERATVRLGRALGTTAFAMHALSKSYVGHWRRAAGDEDALLTHILEDKAGLVASAEPGSEVAGRVAEAARYLADERQTLAAGNTLSHLDFSLANAQIDPDGRLRGYVDWGDFGVTNASLSLYQLAYRAVWPAVQRQYESLAMSRSLGGALRKDVIYAAAAIHLAYAPIICRQHNFPLDADETPERFEAIWAAFARARRN